MTDLYRIPIFILYKVPFKKFRNYGMLKFMLHLRPKQTVYFEKYNGYNAWQMLKSGILKKTK